MEERWDMSGCCSIQTLYSGACKIQLFQRSTAQSAVGLAGSAFGGLGKAEPPRWEMEDAFSLSPPLCSEPP